MDPGTKVSEEDRRGMASNPMESLSLAQDDPEVKRSTTMFSFGTKDKGKEKERGNPTNQLLEHFSSWHKLNRVVAWYLKLKDILLSLSGKKINQV